MFSFSVKARLLAVAAGLAALTGSAFLANELLTNGGIFHRITFELYRDVQHLSDALHDGRNAEAHHLAAQVAGAAAQCQARMGGAGRMLLSALGSGEVIDLCGRAANLAQQLAQVGDAAGQRMERLHHLDETIAALDEPADRLISSVVIFSRAQLAVMAVIGLLMVLQALQAIIGPLGRLRTAAAAFEAGNFDTPVRDTDRRNEMGGLAQALEQFRTSELDRRRTAEAAEQARLAREADRNEQEAERRRLVEQQAEAERARTQAQAERSRAVEAAIAQFDAQSQAIIAEFASMTERLAGQSAGLGQAMDVALTENQAVTDLSGQAALKSQTVASASEQLTVSVSTIRDHMTGTAQRLGQTVDSARRSGERIHDFAALAGQIRTAVTLIDDIATKTNLLALNATIEAARAGAAGQGFAVVAREVKSLAAQTANATREISEMVEGVDTRSEAAIAAITEIIADLEAANAAIEEIGSAVAQQSEATGEINGSVQESAALADQVESRMGRLRGELESTADVSGQIREHAAHLAAMGQDMRQAILTFFDDVRRVQQR